MRYLKFLLITFSSFTFADFEKGLSCYQKLDYACALKEWAPLAEQGNAQAQHELALMYYGAHGVKRDFLEAYRLMRLAAEQGYAVAQRRIGDVYLNSSAEEKVGVKQDYVEAAKWYRLAAEQGDASAQVSLGRCYQYSTGVRLDYFEAVKWYRKAAEQGYVNAQISLARMYEEGLGVRQDMRIAKEWYGKACDNRSGLGCYYYKDLNEQGY